jgi:hypothetical protein
MWWWLLIPAPVMLFYLGIPLLIWKAHRFEETPTIQRIDPGTLPLPADVQQYLDFVATDLQKIGFESRATLLLPSATPHVISLLRMFVNPTEKCSAMANSMIATIKTSEGDRVNHQPYVEFTTRFDDGKVFNTNNSSLLSSFPPAPKVLTTRAPWVPDPTMLHIAHDLITRSRSDGARRVVRLDEAFGGDEVAYLQACMKEEYEHATKIGYMRLGLGETFYRPTLRGAYLMTWKELPPFKQWRARRARAQAERIMEDAGVSVNRIT